MRPVVSAIAAAGLTGLCLWLLLTPEVLAGLARLAGEAKPAPLAAAFAAAAAVQWLRAWRFQVMTTGTLAPPAPAMVLIALKLNFLNFVLPFRLGELSYPALMRRQYGHGVLRSAGVLVLARLFDLAIVAAILLATAGLYAETSAARLGCSLGAAVAALAPLGLLRLGQSLSERLFARSRWAKLAPGAAVAAARQAPVLLALGFSIWLTFALVAVLVARAVAASVAPSAAILGAAAGNLAFALPVNGLAGIGPAQAAFVLAASWAGVPQNDAVVSALALHAVVLSNAVILGGLAFASSWPRRARLSDGPPLP